MHPYLRSRTSWKQTFYPKVQRATVVTNTGVKSSHLCSKITKTLLLKFEINLNKNKYCNYLCLWLVYFLDTFSFLLVREQHYEPPKSSGASTFVYESTVPDSALRGDIIFPLTSRASLRMGYRDLLYHVFQKRHHR